MAKPTLFDAWQALVGDPLHNDPIEVDGVLMLDGNVLMNYIRMAREELLAESSK